MSAAGPSAGLGMPRGLGLPVPTPHPHTRGHQHRWPSGCSGSPSSVPVSRAPSGALCPGESTPRTWLSECAGEGRGRQPRAFSSHCDGRLSAQMSRLGPCTRTRAQAGQCQAGRCGPLPARGPRASSLGRLGTAVRQSPKTAHVTRLTTHCPHFPGGGVRGVFSELFWVLSVLGVSV